MRAAEFPAFVLIVVLFSGVAGPAVVGAQGKPGVIAPPLDSGLLRYSRKIDPALKKILDKRRHELMDMGWLEFWEREEAVWKRLRRLMKQGGEIEQRLVPLEKKKTELIGSLRKLYREERPPSDRMAALVRLRRLSLSILPLADKRAKISGEMKSLFDEWLLFQNLAQELIKRESGRVQADFASSVVDSYVGAFRNGNVKAIRGLLFRGIKVNGRFDRRSYMGRLEAYFKRVKVTAYEVENKDFREVNPFTVRVDGKYKMDESEIGQDTGKSPRSRTRQGNISFTLREVRGRWLIAEMDVPD